MDEASPGDIADDYLEPLLGREQTMLLVFQSFLGDTPQAAAAATTALELPRAGLRDLHLLLDTLEERSPQDVSLALRYAAYRLLPQGDEEPWGKISHRRLAEINQLCALAARLSPAGMEVLRTLLQGPTTLEAHELVELAERSAA